MEMDPGDPGRLDSAKAHDVAQPEWLSANLSQNFEYCYE
jgi:hypothetical protein